MAGEATEVQKDIELDHIKRGTQVEAQGSWHRPNVVGGAKLAKGGGYLGRHRDGQSQIHRHNCAGSTDLGRRRDE